MGARCQSRCTACVVGYDNLGSERICLYISVGLYGVGQCDGGSSGWRVRGCEHAAVRSRAQTQVRTRHAKLRLEQRRRGGQRLADHHIGLGAGLKPKLQISLVQTTRRSYKLLLLVTCLSTAPLLTAILTGTIHQASTPRGQGRAATHCCDQLDSGCRVCVIMHWLWYVHDSESMLLSCIRPNPKAPEDVEVW